MRLHPDGLERRVAVCALCAGVGGIDSALEGTEPIVKVAAERNSVEYNAAGLNLAKIWLGKGIWAVWSCLIS